MKTVTDPDGSQHQEIASVDKYEYNTEARRDVSGRLFDAAGVRLSPAHGHR